MDGSSKKVAQIRRNRMTTKNYGNRPKEYAAEYSSVYSDGTLVSYYVQELLPAT